MDFERFEARVLWYFARIGVVLLIVLAIAFLAISIITIAQGEEIGIVFLIGAIGLITLMARFRLARQDGIL